MRTVSSAAAALAYVLAACGPSPPGDDGSAASTAAGATEPTPPTGDPTTSTSSTGSDSPKDLPAVCGPPCEHTWESDDWLELDASDDLSPYRCMTRAWDLTLTGDIPPERLAVFANLQRVDHDLELVDMASLTDLSAFACLQDARTLILRDMPALTDLSALGELAYLLEFTARRTGIVDLPTFAPGFGGLRYIALESNPALADLGGLASWGTSPDWPITVRLIDNPALTTVTPLAELLARPEHEDIRVRLIGLHALTSLAGLEPMADPSQVAHELHLGDLPLVADLEPLSQLTSVVALTLAGMPKLTTLANLSRLAVAKFVRIGDCQDLALTEGGMDGLTSLAGLDSLNDVYRLTLAGNANLSSLAGAPQLHQLTDVTAVGNPLLTAAAFDEFLAQLLAPPEFACDGDWNECWCSDE